MCFASFAELAYFTVFRVFSCCVIYLQVGESSNDVPIAAVAAPDVTLAAGEISYSFSTSEST